MPNTFAPRAFATVVKRQAESLRQDYVSAHDDQDEVFLGDVKEWHAMIHMLDEESTGEFLDEYEDRKVEEIPDVVDVETL